MQVTMWIMSKEQIELGLKKNPRLVLTFISAESLLKNEAFVKNFAGEVSGWWSNCILKSTMYAVIIIIRNISWIWRMWCICGCNMCLLFLIQLQNVWEALEIGVCCNRKFKGLNKRVFLSNSNNLYLRTKRQTSRCRADWHPS